MDLSAECLEKQILNPLWSSKYNQDFSTSMNVWPIRQHIPPRRFYSTPKTRRSHDIESQFSLRLTTQTTMKIDLEQYDQMKSRSLMDFCSTSKIKYIPLHGSLPDSPYVNYNFPNLNILPALARPVNRPIILHGKRYTIFTLEDNGNLKEMNKIFQRSECISDQRRRFIESERNKINKKLSKDGSEIPEFSVSRSFCLSGRGVGGSSIIHNYEDKCWGPRSILSISKRDKNSMVQKSETLIHSETSDENMMSFGLKDSKEDEKLSNAISDSAISVDIVPNIMTEIVSGKVTDMLKRELQLLSEVHINSELFKRSKQSLLDTICRHMTKWQYDSGDDAMPDVNETEKYWTLLQPGNMKCQEDNSKFVRLFEERIDVKSEDDYEDVVQFISTLYPDSSNSKEANDWLNILSSLKIQSINSSLFDQVVDMIRIFQHQSSSQTLPSHNSLLKAHFWINLFRTIFGDGKESYLDPINYLETVIKIIANTNAFDEDQVARVKDKIGQISIVDHVMLDLVKTECTDQSSVTEVPFTHLLQIIPWLFTVHKEIFHRSFTIDDVATIFATITNRNNQ